LSSTVSPDIIVVIQGISGYASLKPGVFVTRVVRDKVNNQFETCQDKQTDMMDEQTDTNKINTLRTKSII